jgi:anti-sigma B factor antagonist
MSRPHEPRHEGLVVTVRRQRDGAVVALRGELDLATAGDLATRLDALVGRTTDIEIDLSELSFIDCQGIRVLVEAARRHRPRGVVALGSPSAFTRRVLRLLRLEDILPVRGAGDAPTPPSEEEGPRGKGAQMRSITSTCHFVGDPGTRPETDSDLDEA